MGIDLILSIFAEMMALLGLFRRIGGFIIAKISTSERYQTLHLTPPTDSPGFNANLVPDQSEPLS